jgi:hypothetical protein
VIIHVARLVREGIAYSVSTRRASVAIVLVVGLLLLALSLTAQTVAPVALYPFA